MDSEQTARHIREVEAESVALICCETLGLEGADSCRGYQQFELGVVTLNECNGDFSPIIERPFVSCFSILVMLTVLSAYAPLTIIAFRPINEPTEGRNIGDLSPISG